MTTIPVFIFEEHNEAFFVWHYAVQKNWLPKSGNTLLHIDEHSDMGIPRFTYSINSLNGNLQQLYDFTYNELTIENFIIPAIYQQLFNKIYWVRQSKDVPLPSAMCVYTYDDGKVLTARSLEELGTKALFDTSYKKAKFKCLNVEQRDEFPERESVILDVDLDYFSCNNKYHNFQGELEITEEQYHSFRQDHYQFMRLALGSGVKAKVEDGKYYLVFNDFAPDRDDKIPNVLKVSEEKILARLDRIIDLLKTKQIDIKLIDICRSQISGFTPSDQCQFIEDNLLAKLGEIYDLEIMSLDRVYQQERLAA